MLDLSQRAIVEIAMKNTEGIEHNFEIIVSAKYLNAVEAEKKKMREVLFSTGKDKNLQAILQSEDKRNDKILQHALKDKYQTYIQAFGDVREITDKYILEKIDEVVSNLDINKEKSEGEQLPS